MRIFKTLLLLAIFSILVSCGTRKEVVYFQGLSESSEFTPSNYKSIIKPNDLLSIIVSGQDMLTVSPYNRIVPSVAAGNTTSLIAGQQQLQSYLVDSEGNINFPTIGKIDVSGLSRLELEDKIYNFVKPSVPNAEVVVRFLNFKITVLGEVARPGTFTVEDERVTLPQALGLAGDLTLFGERSDVLILRDNNGVQESHRVDLTDASFLDTEQFYLRQNDVVYVSPNKARANGSSFNQNSPLYVSIASLLLSVIILIAR